MFPFEGLTVVALEQAVAAPFATRQLADLGARVIKIERPTVGDFARNYDHTVKGLSSHFVWLNRSKESLSLDLKQKAAKDILHSLLSTADIFIQNLAPGAVDRLGFDSQTLREKYPHLIICNISGYGQDGPYSGRKAYDLMIQCEAGLVSITGTEDSPAKAGISIADIAAGMYALTGMLTALHVREQTNQGTVIEISMLEALAEWMGYPLYYSCYGNQEPMRTGANHATIYPYGPFRTGDQNTVFFGIQNEREWIRFCNTVLHNPDLAEDTRFCSNEARVANREQLAVEVQEIFANLTIKEALERLENAQIANAKQNTVREFANHPQLQSRNRWREVESPVGSLKALLPPITMDGVDIAMNPIPTVGQHNEAILHELGYSASKISCLLEDHVL